MAGVKDNHPTSSPLVFPASPGLLPESVEGWTTTAISGLNCIDLFWKQDRIGLYLKTFLTSSRWRVALTGYSLTWKAAATHAGRSLYRLRLSGPTTAAIGSGLWPTVTTIDATMQAKGKVGQKGRHAVQLSHLANSGRILHDDWHEMPSPQGNHLWPTPNSAKAGNDVTLKASGDGREKPNKLGWAVAQQMWPTPQHEGFDAGAHRGEPDSLHAAVKMLPTPTATAEHVSDMLNQQLSGQQRAKLKAQGTPFNASTGGMKLSARWVAALMGYPEGYLDDLPSDPLGKPASPASPSTNPTA